jgi:hypothetical protein
MKHLLLLSTLLLTATTAQGRIFESTSQCAARYGEPIAVDPAQMRISYQSGPIHITAYFLDRRVQKIVYSKREGKTRLPLTREEVLTFLKANSATTWDIAPISEDNTTVNWTSTPFTASWNTQKQTLTIVTTDWISHQATQETARLGSF